MKQSTEVLNIPIYVSEFMKSETSAGSIDDIVDAIRQRIAAHPIARFIGVFDHFAHTRGLVDGEIAPEIQDARCVVFCFGMAIPEPLSLATRPRSIGICELRDRFVLSFLEPPMPIANREIEKWVQGLVTYKREPVGEAALVAGSVAIMGAEG